MLTPSKTTCWLKKTYSHHEHEEKFMCTFDVTISELEFYFR